MKARPSFRPSAFLANSRSAPGALFVAFALTASLGCSGNQETSASQDSDLVQLPHSCGVGPGDASIASALRPKLVGSLKGNAIVAENVACARVITRIAWMRGLGQRGAEAAVTASLGGTALENMYIPSPLNQWGVFGQRPSPEWGSREQLQDPNYAANTFFDIMLRTFPNDSWRTLSPNVVAEGVQKSLVFTRYDDEISDSYFIVDAVSGTTCPGFPNGRAVGAIEDKYLALGGCNSVLGAPTTTELGSPDNRGRFTVFVNGSIYWRDDIGAHEVHGAIRDTWRDLGWETGGMGYPVSDETGTPDGIGSYNVFEGGSVYWTPDTGAHEVRGAIRDKWAALGWEGGALGYPVSGEVQIPAGVRSDFQHGSITWTRATGAISVALTADSDAGK